LHALHALLDQVFTNGFLVSVQNGAAITFCDLFIFVMVLLWCSYQLHILEESEEYKRVWRQRAVALWMYAFDHPLAS